eukprot:364443-Chlamydomonas_euryale.AAC.6
MCAAVQDVHEVLAVVVSGRRESLDLGRRSSMESNGCSKRSSIDSLDRPKQGQHQQVPMSAPVQASSAMASSPFAALSSARGIRNSAAIPIPATDIIPDNSVTPPARMSAFGHVSSLFGSSASNGSTAPAWKCGGRTSSDFSAMLPASLGRVSSSGIGRGIADFEVASSSQRSNAMFHMDNDRNE